jgi:S1-C subfamily serine protease
MLHKEISMVRLALIWIAIPFMFHLVPANAKASDALLGLPVEAPSGAHGTSSGLTPVLPPVPTDDFLSPNRMASVLRGITPDAHLVTRSGGGASVYLAVSPSVVLVVTDTSLGSGALLNSDGDIITNWHVIQGAERVGVIFKPDEEGGAISAVDIRRAEVKKIDEVSDLALLRVEVVPPGRKPVAFSFLNDVLIGADVHAIGHPSGQSWTYTRGFVSQIRRGYEWATESGVKHKADVIQTQTPINPGNSGGPLLNEAGQLIGINSFKAEGEALNFAVAVDEVKTFLERPQGRQAARAQPAPAVAVKCEPRILASERRELGGGPGEMAWIDTDCDGQVDFQLFVPDDARQPIVSLMDTTGNGQIDLILFDDNRDGNFDRSIIDTNGDGSPDLQGFYRNGETEPYRVQRIN